MYNNSRMSKILATDLDGTLMYPKRITHCIPRKNVKFLRRWIDSGNKLVLITSRSAAFVERLYKEIDREFDVITCTSSQIFHNREIIFEEKMPNEVITRILREVIEVYKPIGLLVTSKKYPCLVYDTGRAGFLLKVLYKLWYAFQFAYKEPLTISSKKSNKVVEEELLHGDIFKIMTFFGLNKKNGELSKKINKELRQNYPEIESSWSLIVNELTPKDCNKGAGLERYCNLLNIDKKDVIVVGDSGNDITMFEKFHENSYVMGHAYPSVKKYARYTINRVYHLEKLLKEQQKGETTNE